jgi:hypothetical protein
MEHTMRKPIVLGLLAGFAALAALTAVPADAKVPGPNGRIAFARFDPAMDGTVTYTVNPDGSQVEQLFIRGQSEFPHWSPDGSEVSIFTACTDGEEDCAATIVDPDTGTFRQFKGPTRHSRRTAPSGLRTANDSPARASG